MEPRKPGQELEQTQEPRPDEKKRRFRLVKLEEQRFRMVKLEDRIAPLAGLGTNSTCLLCGTGYACATGNCTFPPGHCK